MVAVVDTSSKSYNAVSTVRIIRILCVAVERKVGALGLLACCGEDEKTTWTRISPAGHARDVRRLGE